MSTILIVSLSFMSIGVVLISWLLLHKWAANQPVRNAVDILILSLETEPNRWCCLDKTTEFPEWWLDREKVHRAHQKTVVIRRVPAILGIAYQIVTPHGCLYVGKLSTRYYKLNAALNKAMCSDVLDSVTDGFSGVSSVSGVSVSHSSKTIEGAA